LIALDTNILVYALGTEERSKQARSLVLHAALAGAIVPIQVLSEFANVCRRKDLLAEGSVSNRLAELAGGFHTPATSLSHVQGAVALAARYQLAFFDALICTIAAHEGASHLISEDMKDGLVMDGITILNPFLPDNRERLEALLNSH